MKIENWKLRMESWKLKVESCLIMEQCIDVVKLELYGFDNGLWKLNKAVSYNKNNSQLSIIHSQLIQNWFVICVYVSNIY